MELFLLSYLKCSFDSYFIRNDNFNGRSGRGFRRWQFLEEKHYKRAKADILTKNKMKVILKKIYND